MYKEFEIKKYDDQERQKALDWLKNRVRERVPFAKGFVRFTQEEIDQITIEDERQNKLNAERLWLFLLMCWYNWVDDGGDTDGHRYTLTSCHESAELCHTLPYCCLEEFDGQEYPDEYTFADIVTILCYEQEIYPFRTFDYHHITEPKPNWFCFITNLFESRMFYAMWDTLYSAPDLRDLVFEKGTCKFPEPFKPAPAKAVEDEDLF